MSPVVDKTDDPKPQGPWLQFHLRTLLMWMAAWAGVLSLARMLGAAVGAALAFSLGAGLFWLGCIRDNMLSIVAGLVFLGAAVACAILGSL